MDFEFINHPDAMKTMVADAVAQARAAGVDAAQASVVESAAMNVGVRRGQLETLDIDREYELSLTVYCNGGTGAASIGEVSASALRELVERAVVIARLSQPDPHAGLADAELMATDFPDLSLFHPWSLAVDDAIALAKEGEEATFAAHPEISRSKSEGASVHSGVSLVAYANSHGFCAAEQLSSHTLACGALAIRDGQMERDGWSEAFRDAADLPPISEVGHKAGTLAARRLGGGKVGDQTVRVLFAAPSGHTLIRHFIAAARGGALYRKASWLVDALESPVFAPHMSIRELPHITKRHGSTAYDSEGVATRPRTVVQDGVWRECFLSAYSARRLGMQTTANAGGVHNIRVDAKRIPADRLLEELGTGVMVTDLMGQGVNEILGDYSRGAAGFWVENGEIAYPLSEITLAGNLRAMLPAIVGMGDDTMVRGSLECGSLLVEEMVLGGNAGQGAAKQTAAAAA